MEHAFWHERWQQNQIGFHRQDIHAALHQQWTKLDIMPGSRVMVPMCGKSNDLLWLLNQGYQVLGIELSPLAVEAFFTENNLQPKQRQQGNFLLNEIDELQILCGDFFALQPTDLPAQVDAAYDRASLVALPPPMRIDYALKMKSLLNSGTKTLLVSLEYPDTEMSGPPFSVSHQEIHTLYSSWCEIELLVDKDVLDEELHLKNRGLSRLSEQIYKLGVK